MEDIEIFNKSNNSKSNNRHCILAILVIRCGKCGGEDRWGRKPVGRHAALTLVEKQEEN